MPNLIPTGITPLTDRGVALRESRRYRMKRRILGPPLTTDQLQHERLSKKIALGVLSSDCISSSAYGTEEILISLLPAFGIAGFSILMPMTAVVLGVLVLTTLSYREVVMVYTKSGGSYVVARANFGPVIAQLAAVALMLDYIVTVAVQSAAGTAAVISAIPAIPNSAALPITCTVVAILYLGNLRGIKEAGKFFAFPTYFFAGSMFLVIGVGIFREITGSVGHINPYVPGAYTIQSSHGLMSMVGIFYLLRAFANGGSSLTGLEAISDSVSAFKEPTGINARRTLVIMSVTLGTLVAGVSWLAHVTHAVPYYSGTPTVISQVAHAALGTGPVGHVLFLMVQLATMLILWTGANTSFNGFPFLAKFVADDGFLPRWLLKRGHRLAFSNGITLLFIASMALLIGTNANVNSLVAFYAIGVFTAFTFAGFGMSKYFQTNKPKGYRGKIAINMSSGALSLLVVIIFVITKFTEGAWLVVLLFPILSLLLLRLHREYVAEEKILEAAVSQPRAALAAHQVVIVLVDSIDLATLRTLNYARSFKAAKLRVVHFMLDGQHAQDLEAKWSSTSATGTSLEIIDCPDRRLIRSVMELALEEAADPRAQVSVLLPRRVYSPLLGRILHDHTADKIADALSSVPRVAATIVPYNVRAAEWLSEQDNPTPSDSWTAVLTAAEDASRHLPAPTAAGIELLTVPTDNPAAADDNARLPIGSLTWRQRALVEGKVHAIRVTPLSGHQALEVEVWDSSGGIKARFYGRHSIPGIKPGTSIRLTGMVGESDGHLAMANPSYELLPPGA